jgi:hypothetical protein
MSKGIRAKRIKSLVRKLDREARAYKTDTATLALMLVLSDGGGNILQRGLKELKKGRR